MAARIAISADTAIRSCACPACRGRRPSWQRTRRRLPGRALPSVRAASSRAAWPPSSPSISTRNNSSARRVRARNGCGGAFSSASGCAYGDRPFALLPPEWIEALLDAKPPHAARSWLVTLRSLCQFAVKRGWLRADPTRDIKLRSIKSDGFHTWTDDEIAQFEAHHPIGTKPRLALALLLYTAQRRSDVVRMGRQHIRGRTGRADGQAAKDRRHAWRSRCIRELQTVLDATPSEHLTFLTPTTGKPYDGNVFQRELSRMVRRSRIAETLLGARTAQGRLSPNSRKRDAQPTRSCASADTQR